MGYLDYTLAKLNATKALEDQRYRDRQLEEANKAQFISSLVGLVPQAIGGIKGAVDKQAATEDSLNKLRLQEALLTGGDNTLASVGPLTGIPVKTPANTVPKVADVISEIESGSDGPEGPPVDTSPDFNKYAVLERDARKAPYSIKGDIVPGSVRRLDKIPGISGSITESKPVNIESSFDIAQALKALAAAKAAAPAVASEDDDMPAGDVDIKESTSFVSDGPDGPPTDTSPSFVPDPNRDMGKSSFNYNAQDIRSKLGLFNQANLGDAKAATKAADIKKQGDKLMAAEKAAAPIPATRSDGLDTGRRGGPSMPGAVGDENVPDESPKAYRKRMERKGYNTKQINELSKKYFGSATGTLDITDEVGGGPPVAPQVGGDFNSSKLPEGSIGGEVGGFGGAPAAAKEKPWVKSRVGPPPPPTETDIDKAEAEETNKTGKTTIDRLRERELQKDVAADFNQRIKSYKRITNSDFKEPDIDKLAEKAVSEIFDNRPPGNPITNMINSLSGNGGMTSERDRLLRSIAKKTIKKNITAERTAIADKEQAEFLATAKIELDAATAQNKAFGLTVGRKQIPDSARKELDSQREANSMLNDVRDKAFVIAEKDGQLPFGKDRFISEARIKQAAGAIGSTSDAISGGFFGLSGGQSKGRSVQMDAQLLSDAFQAMDFSDLPTDQQELLSLTKQSVQILGKAREGGKLTDADYVKYLQTLFNSSNPAGFIRSLDESINRNATRYNNNLTYFQANYMDDLSMYDPGGLRDQNVDIDFTKVKETPLMSKAKLAPSDGRKASPPPSTQPPLDD